MYLEQWDISLDPFKQTVLTEIYICQRTQVRNKIHTEGVDVHISRSDKFGKLSNPLDVSPLPGGEFDCHVAYSLRAA